MSARTIAAVLVSVVLQAQAIPPGPPVPISDGWYHVATCPIAEGRKAPSIPLSEALQQQLRPCPICEPHTANPAVGAFVAAHGKAIAEDLRRKADAEAAEAKRKEEERLANLKRRIAEDAEARKSRESAPLVRVEEARARQLAEAAAAQSAGDPAAFQREFRTALRQVAPDYNGPQVVFGSAALRIFLAGPLARFEANAMEAVRTGQPVARVAWAPEASVVVVPQQPDALDIERIVVQRSDTSRPLGSEVVVTPLSTTLSRKPVQFASGATRVMHAGEVTFPLSAFNPGDGVMVRVIAVPAGAAPINRTFTSLQLRAVQ